MKRYNAKPQMDEREKLRKFRELDDAFADALRALDKDTQKDEGVNAEEQAGVSSDQQFEQRLMALINEYQQTPDSVSELLSTMLSLGKIA